MAKSIEESVEDWAKRQLDPQGRHDLKKSAPKWLPYYAKTETINSEIENALKTAPSKNGGPGENRPDIKVMVDFGDFRVIPVMIEVKGKKGALKKTFGGKVANINNDGTPNYDNINKYAVNGAVHYADAIIRYSQTYKEAIAVGINGYDEAYGNRKYEVEAYYLSKDNLYEPKLMGDYDSLSILLPQYRQDLLKRIGVLNLTPKELEKKQRDMENEIERNLKAINQMIYDREDKDLKIEVGKRVQLITGLVMAGLGVKGAVAPLEVSELKGQSGTLSNDGQIIMNKISDFLEARHLPSEKINMIKDVLNVVFLHSHLQDPSEGGETPLHIVYSEVYKKILPFLRGDLHSIDFTGRLFNVLNEWVDVPDGDKNDVVLTPRYVTQLMAAMCRVDRNSFVWDWAVGSAGFLISSMQLMLDDARKHIEDPLTLRRTENHIKMEQLLGIEQLPDVYMLAVLNMILMQDGSSNIIHGDSLKFDGCYEQGENLKDKPFPATVFLLNPPYSQLGKGFIFVERALSMMQKHGKWAAVLIQENAGSGAGLPYTAKILENNTLVCSIHMSDIFCGKANVQTAIYLFQVGQPHRKENIVRFIDFSNDGYTRTNRKKSSQSVNLRDTDHAHERYQEVLNLSLNGAGVNNENLHYFKDCYVEDHISLDGNDWTYGQHRKIDTVPKFNDFMDVVKNYLDWRVSEILKNDEREDSLGKNMASTAINI